MSATIDQRVVEMRFDNSHFEKNVSTTMSTLDKLKSKLNLSGASTGLNDVNTAAKNFSNTGLSGAVETVTAKFSALQVMGVTALANITNSAITAGTNIVKSLTLDPIMSGFSEYETKLGSIQTILANTEHQGTTMDDVTAALEELNLYADKTIYNFQEMTRNIGTFTAAGVDLDTSVRSIQGIANLAAISGSTSQQASTAMYQLSQALASGTVKLMDWNSVVNAGMGGKVFQNALMETARVHGVAIDEMIEDQGSFRETLSEGWLTSDILTETLEHFTMAAEEGSEAWEEYKKSLMDTGYTEEQAESILKMANTATDAATKVKTFTQLMDTLKESAQSGWAQTWELLIGDFEEAKSFFTELSDLFGGIIGDSANRRNSYISEVFGSNWDKLISQINEAGIETEQFEDALRQVIGDTKFDKLIEDFGSIGKAAKEGEISSDNLRKAIASLGEEAKSAFDFSGMAEKVKGNRFTYSMGGNGRVSDEVRQIQEALNELGYEVSPDGKFGKATYQAVMEFQKAAGIRIDGIVGEETIAALEKATGKTKELTGDTDKLLENCDSLIDVVTKTSGRELMLDSLKNVIEAIVKPLQAVGEAFRNIFTISPDKLYNALVKIEEFTSGFVMKGLLDITKWDELTGVLETLGISTGEFTSKLQEVLTEHGIDVAKLRDQYGSLSNAFNEGAISIDHIKEALLGFDGITEAMLIGGETAEKVRRTFAGLFAIFDIIATITGGALRVGFEIITELLSRFDLDILDVTANIGDAIVRFRDFVDSLLNVSGIVDFLFPYVEKLVKAIGNFIDAVKESGVLQQFADYLRKVGDGLMQLALAIPSLDSFKNLISVLKDCGTAFIEWCAALKESDNIPEDIISGLVNGLTSGASRVVSAVIQLGLDIIKGICSALGIHSPSTEMMEVGEYAVDGLVIGLQNGASGLWSTIKDIGEKIIEWFKNIDFGSLFSIGVAAGLVWVVKMVSDALSILAVPFEGFGDMLEDLGDMFEGIGAKFKAEAWESRANAIKTFAIAVAILAASVWALAQIEDHGKLWSAVMAISMLAIVIGILAVAIEKITSSDGFKSLTSGVKLSGLAATLVGLSVALIAMSIVVNQISDLNPEQADQAFKGLVTMMGSLTVFVAACGAFLRGDSSKNISKLGGMMIKLSVALLLMVAVVKLVSKLSTDELTAGGSFIIAFLAFTAALSALGAIPGKGVEGVGTMMLKISASLLLMIAVVKLAGQLSNENGELTKAAAFVGAFLAFVLLLQLISLIPAKDISKLGSTLTGISTAMLIMVVVAKLIAGMEWGDMGKAAVGIFGLTVIIALLVGIVDSMGGDAPKIAGTLLAISISMAILAGIAILMSLMSVEGLAKGLAAVTVLGLIIRAMVMATWGVEKCVGELVVLTVAVGLLAGVVAALSLIEPSKLTAPVLAMTVLMGMFALMVKSSNNVNGSMGTLIVMAGVVAILGGLIYLLAGLPVDSVIGIAASLSVLLLSLVVSLKILDSVNSVSPMALVAVAVMVVIVGLLGGLLWLLKDLPVESTMGTATALSTLLLSMSASLAILTLVGSFAPAALAGLGLLALLITGLAVVMATLGGLANEWEGFGAAIDTGMEVLGKLGRGLGEFFGELIDGFLSSIVDGLPDMATNLSNFMTNLQPFIDGASSIDPMMGDNIKTLCSAILAIAGTELVTAITNWLTGGDSITTFATQIKSFGSAMKDYAAEVAGLDTAAINNSVTAARGLVQVAQAIPGDGFLGLDGIDDFGRNIVTFGRSIRAYAEQVVGLDIAAITNSVTAAKGLVTIAQSIPSDGFLGLDGIDDFGRNIGGFGKGMKAYAEQVADIDAASITASVGAANGLLNVARMIPDDGTLGMDGIDDFGKNIKSFGKSMKSYADEVAELNTSAVTGSVSSARSLVSFITSLSGIDTSGVKSFKDAVKNLAKVNVGDVVEAFSSASSSLKTVGGDMVSNIIKGFKSNQAQFKATGATVVNDLAAMIKTKATLFVNAGTILANNLIKGFESQKSQIRSSVQESLNTAVTGARSYYTNFYNAGYYVASGFADGIDSGTYLAVAKARAMADAAEEAAREELGINSPSKVFMGIGGSIPEGFAMGIDKYGYYVKDSITSMSDDAFSQTTNAISNIANAINSDVDAQPTIAPVLDLSNIETGVGAINNMLNDTSTVGVMANVGAVSTMMNRRSQNGANTEVVSAIDKLRKDVGKIQSNTYSIGGVSYDDGSAVGNAVFELVRAMRVEGRI